MAVVSGTWGEKDRYSLDRLKNAGLSDSYRWLHLQIFAARCANSFSHFLDLEVEPTAENQLVGNVDTSPSYKEAVPRILLLLVAYLIQNTICLSKG